MSYLIDGSNLGGVGGGRAGSRDARAVVEWLLPWIRERAGRGRLIVVFDGSPRPDVALRYGPMAVEFAAPRTADEAILARVRSSPKRWIVVTDDGALARACRDLGATTQAASTLVRSVLSPSGGKRSKRPGAVRPGDEKPHPSGSDQAHWKAVFGGGSGGGGDSSDPERGSK